MITNNTIKFIKSLQNKKSRHDLGFFIVEGYKSVLELLKSDFEVVDIYYTDQFEIKNESINVNNFIKVSAKDLDRMTHLTSNDEVLALVKIKKSNFPTNNETTIVLDDINDPGNLGTIIRTADWFGIKHLVCSSNTVDYLNSKSISASKGSFLRVNVVYTNLEEYFKTQKRNVFGAYMDGILLESVKIEKGDLIVLGNESNGISDKVKPYITQKITISGGNSTESLNVAISAGIILNHFYAKI